VRDIKRPLADKIIALEQVSVPSLQSQFERRRAWSVYIEQQSVVEIGFPILVSVMSVRLLFVCVADESFDVHVRGAFPVLHRNTSASKHSKSDFKLAIRFGSDLPDFATVATFGGWVNVDPHVNHALVHGGAHVVQLASLDRLLFDSLPFRVEESVIQVDACLADQIVSE